MLWAVLLLTLLCVVKPSRAAGDFGGEVGGEKKRLDWEYRYNGNAWHKKIMN